MEVRVLSGALRKAPRCGAFLRPEAEWRLDSGPFSHSSTTVFGLGTVLLTHYSGAIGHTTQTTETVTYDLQVAAAAGTDGTCSFVAQIVPSN